MADNRFIGISGRPSLRLPMVAQGLNTLQQFVPHALVVTFKMIVGRLFSKLPRLDYGVHAIQISSFPVICGVLQHVVEPYLTGFRGRLYIWIGVDSCGVLAILKRLESLFCFKITF